MRNRTLFLAWALAVAAAACSGNDPTSTEKDSSSADDDLTVVESVPMGLVQNGFLVRIRTSVLPVGAGGDAASRDAAPTSVAAEQLAVAQALVAVPGRAATEGLRFVDSLLNVLDAVFAPGSPLGQKAVDIKVSKKTGRGARLFTYPQASGAPRIARVSVGEGDGFRYRLEIHEPDAKGERYTRETRMDFDRAAPTSDDVRVHVEHRFAVDAGAKRYVIADYEQRTGVLTMAFGDEPLDPRNPARTTIELRREGEAQELSLRGGFFWKRPTLASTALVPPPRPYAPQDGDVELFAMAARLDGEVPTAQKMAYLEAGAKPLAADEDPFVTRPYAAPITAYVERLVRDVAVNVTCAETGKALRDTGATATATLPDDVCSTNAAVAAGVVVQAIAGACAEGKNLGIEVETSAGPAVLNLCVKLVEARVLANPQLIATDADGQRIQSLSKTGDGGEGDAARFAAVKKTLAGLAPLPIETVASEGWFTITPRPRADLEKRDVP